MSARQIRVLLVDDHALVRSTVAERLRKESDILVVGEVDNADDSIGATLEHKPDVVLMDIDMPGLLCFDAASRINTLRPEVSVIYLSAFFNDRFIQQALEAKASGYLTKSEPPETVIKAIREVASGGAYFSTEVQSRIVVGARGAKLAQEPKSRVSTLTPREVQILQYLARGLAKKEIAQTLSISVKTVDRHTFNLMEKLNIHDRVGLARFAIREGLAEA